jgi:hypothetical protein
VQSASDAQVVNPGVDTISVSHESAGPASIIDTGAESGETAASGTAIASVTPSTSAASGVVS